MIISGVDLSGGGEPYGAAGAYGYHPDAYGYHPYSASYPGGYRYGAEGAYRAGVYRAW